MNALIILFLILLGIVLLMIEFTILPGITIAGIGGLLLLAASVYMAFEWYGMLIGFITLAFVIVIAPVLFIKFFKSKSGKKMLLETEITGVANEIDSEKIKVGDEGITIGRLAPTGKAKINGISVEVKSTGSYVDPGTKIKIIEINKSQIVVEPIKQE